MEINLFTPAAALTRVGKTTASRLKKLGLETVEDLIFYFPYRWQDFSQIFSIAEVKPGDGVSVRGKIQLINNRRSFAKRKNLTEALVADDSGSIKVVWFNQPYLAKTLQPGDEVYLSGKVDFDKYALQFVNPIYEKAGPGETIHTARLVPVYSLTGNLTQKQLRFLIKMSLPAIKQITDYLPPAIIKERHLLDLRLALRQIHFPDSQELIDRAIRRLKFDELLFFQLQVLAHKAEIESSASWPINFDEQRIKAFVGQLPFKLTDDQRKAAWQIVSDLEKSHPMNRLLEGDVGSGKTVVAAIAMLNAAVAGKQCVLMVPTEILAWQHYNNFLALFKNSGLKIALLTRSQQQLGGKKESKEKIKKFLAAGKIEIIIGTHSLIQEEIQFADLALAIIDEQHRFGVAQRQRLRQKIKEGKFMPHLLSMTATPIPRSLALTLYGDLDLSLIREMPKDRKKIITRIVSAKNRPQAYDFIRAEIRLGHQAFVICPLIDLSDKLGVKAVSSEHAKLDKEIFPELKVGLLHGKLKAAEKEKVMADFLAKKYDLLVATSVVEVGVDVPNATVMIIEGADRFGLSQLHQFRGRVGRSAHQSYCFLFTDNYSPKTAERLQAFVAAKDGFELAEFDLKFRGPGEIYGTKQSGYPEFQLAQLTDYDLIAEAKITAQKLLAESGDLKKYPLLKKKVGEVMEKIHLE